MWFLKGSSAGNRGRGEVYKGQCQPQCLNRRGVSGLREFIGHSSGYWSNDYSGEGVCVRSSAEETRQMVKFSISLHVQTPISTGKLVKSTGKVTDDTVMSWAVRVTVYVTLCFCVK